MTRRAVSRTVFSIVGCAAVALFLNSCGSSSPNPTSPEQQPSPSATPAATPAPSPTPSPAATPAPEPTPSPAPTPTPVPSPAPSPTPSPSALVIEIVTVNGRMGFVPATANVQVGQQVRWHNADSTTHTATQNGGGFDTGFIARGATSAPITVTTAGTLNYHCELHPEMVGALRVTQ